MLFVLRRLFVRVPSSVAFLAAVWQRAMFVCTYIVYMHAHLEVCSALCWVQSVLFLLVLVIFIGISYKSYLVLRIELSCMHSSTYIMYFVYTIRK